MTDLQMKHRIDSAIREKIQRRNRDRMLFYRYAIPVLLIAIWTLIGLYGGIQLAAIIGGK